MWPTSLPIVPEIRGQLMVMCALAVAFVTAVFVAILARRVRSRREIRALTCPENHRRALVVLQRSPDGVDHDRVVRCSRWHDGELDCGERCLPRLARSSASARRRRSGSRSSDRVGAPP